MLRFLKKKKRLLHAYTNHPQVNNEKLEREPCKKTEHNITQIDVLNEKNNDLEDRIIAQNKSLIKQNDNLKKRINILIESQKHFRKNIAVNRYLTFAQFCEDIAPEIKADVYVGHGIHSLPAVDILARSVGGKKFSDVIEIPSFFDRIIVPNWHISNIVLLDNAFESYLRQFDGLLTVGWALKDEINHYGPPVTVLPNYRYAEELKPNNILREMCHIDEDQKIILSISTVTAGFEDVVKSLLLVEDYVHLVVIGDLKPEKYENQIRDLIKKLNLEKRVHIFPKVEYEKLTSIASAANVGLIIRDPAILNNRISLPNRIFDYMFSGVPVCTPDIKDITRIVKKYSMGEILHEISPQGWACAIRKVLNDNHQKKRNALLASKDLVWEKVEDDLYEALGCPKKVTYVSINYLKENNRTMRMAKSLINKGVEVTICYPHDEKPHIENGIKFFPTTKC